MGWVAERSRTQGNPSPLVPPNATRRCSVVVDRQGQPERRRQPRRGRPGADQHGAGVDAAVVGDHGGPARLVEDLARRRELDAVGQLPGQGGDVALRVDRPAAGVEQPAAERRELRRQVVGRQQLVGDAGRGQARRVAVARAADEQRAAVVDQRSPEALAGLLPAAPRRDGERDQLVQVVDVAEDAPRARRLLGAGRLGLEHRDAGAAILGGERRRQPDHPGPDDQEVGTASRVSARSSRPPESGQPTPAAPSPPPSPSPPGGSASARGSARAGCGACSRRSRGSSGGPASRRRRRRAVYGTPLAAVPMTGF